MTDLAMPATWPCPFCGADAEAGWVVDQAHGKSIKVKCSREGECPSPQWEEPAREHEDDAACVHSVVSFWNTRAADWSLDGWQSMRGTKPKAPVLVFTIQSASDRKFSEAMGAEALPYQPFAIARWQRGKWRDVVTGRIYLVRAWRHLVGPNWVKP